MAAPKGEPAKRPTPEEIRQRLGEVEQLLVRRLSSRYIQQVLSQRWGVTTRQVRDYISKVRAAWRAEAEGLAPEAKEARVVQRDHMRATLNDAFSRAMGRTEVVRDAAGNPVVDPATGRPTLREVPDLSNAMRAAGLLMDLDALGADRKVEIKHSGRVGGLGGGPAVIAFADRTEAELKHYLLHGAWPAANGRDPAPAPPAAGTDTAA